MCLQIFQDDDGDDQRQSERAFCAAGCERKQDVAVRGGLSAFLRIRKPRKCEGSGERGVGSRIFYALSLAIHMAHKQRIAV
jgi:hypothetical protein